MITCSYVEVGGARGIDNESYVLDDGVWTPVAAYQEYKEYLSIKGSTLKDPIEDYKVINNELKSYGFGLDKRPCILVASKMDEEGSEENEPKKFGFGFGIGA